MKKKPLLTTKEIEKFLKRYPEWSVNAKQNLLYRTIKFENHIDALVFIARVTVFAEVQQHHPDIEFSYSKVKVKLTTHEVKGLTKKDLKLASRIEKSISG